MFICIRCEALKQHFIHSNIVRMNKSNYDLASKIIALTKIVRDVDNTKKNLAEL